jgi:hypothetical protein
LILRGASTVPSLGDVAEDTWPSTGAIDTETASLATSVAQLGRDIFDGFGRDAYPIDDAGVQALQNAWNAFLADFNQWKDAAWFWNPSRRDELVSYRAKFNALLAQWQSVPQVITVAKPVAGAAPAKSSLDKAADIAGSLVWIVGIGAAVWIGHTVYREMRSPR